MRQIKYDGDVQIAVGNSRKCIAWQNKNLMWSELVKRLAIVQRTSETEKEYFSMRKTERDNVKDCGGFVGGVLKNGRRKAENVVSRRLLTLDMDDIPPGADPWSTVELGIGYSAVLYSTHSHSKKSPRYRLVMPLSRAVTPEEYTALSRKVASDIGIDMCDDTTYEAHRLMYWPSAPIDAEYRFEVLDAPWINVDEQLKRYVDWRDSSQWPSSSRKTDIMQRLAKKQGDPTEKNGVVGAFCRVYDVEQAIEQFLPEIYSPSAMPDRYDYIPADSSAGVVIYEDGKFAYSHHASDPVCGKLCNAFDLVRLHLYGDLDDGVQIGTAVTKLPSYQAMSELAINDADVRTNLMQAKIQELSTAFDDGENPTEWLKLLSVSPKGTIEPTIDNVLIIMQNDPTVKHKYFYDEFRERPVVCDDLPWSVLRQRSTDVWQDLDDAGLRHLLEKKYGITGIAKIYDAVEIAMSKAYQHPVREYLQGLVWDGIKRADTLFVDYLGAENSEYTREVTRKALIGAVARILKPGCKHDHILVLVGPQGCRKSTTLAKLGKNWFSDSLYTITGKDAYEQLQGYWIIEMGEMAATRKAELEQIKQFISKQSDNYRSAYARRTAEHPRQCAFFGSTNDDEFLRDPTGARRFWPVRVTAEGIENGDKLTGEIVDQIWAEIVVRYQAGETWYLNTQHEQLARAVQEQHSETDDKTGLVENFLNTLLPADWSERNLDARRLFWQGGFGEENVTVKRTKVCALEIYTELFGGDIKSYNQQQSRSICAILRRLNWQSIGAYKYDELYGKQKIYSCK